MKKLTSKLSSLLERICLGPKARGEKVDLSWPPSQVKAKTSAPVEKPEFNNFWIQLWLRKA